MSLSNQRKDTGQEIFKRLSKIGVFGVYKKAKTPYFKQITNSSPNVRY